MPKIGDMLESKFMKKDDVGDGALFTVKSCEQHNVAAQGAEPEHKWCLTFEESDKPLVLNSTNIQLCGAIFASDDTDDWSGQRIVLYTDPTIMYAGKVVGGIRVRKPRPSAASKAKPKPAPVDGDDDTIPF